MSIEGGIPGRQHNLTCPNCGKVFTAWRPDTAPGVKVKCYFCKTEVEDEAARRIRVEAPAPPPAAPPEPATPAATAPGPPAEPAPPATPPEPATGAATAPEPLSEPVPPATE